jgi:DHA1 family multidrug resistance protein-like MFS transporter
MSAETPKSEAPPESPVGAFYVLLGVTVLVNMGGGVIIPIMPLLLKSHGFVPASLSAVFTALIAARFLSQNICGRLVARIGAMRVLVAALVLYTSVMLTYTQVHGTIAFVACRAAEGLVEGAAIVSLNDLVLALTTPATRGRRMGQFSAAFGMGFIIGPLVGSSLLHWGGQNAVFVGTAVIAATGAITIIVQRAALSVRTSGPPRKGSIRDLGLAFLNLLPFYSPQTLRRVLFFALQMILPLYLSERFGIPADRVGLYFSFSAILSTVLMPLAGRMVDRLRPDVVVTVCMVVMAGTIVGFSMATSTLVFTVFYAIETVAFAVMLPAAMKFFGDLVAPRSDRAIILGAFGGVTDLTTLLVPLVVLPLYGFGTQWAWLLLAVLPTIVALPFARHALSRTRVQTEQPG